MKPALKTIEKAILSAEDTWLFLDYDGTLAPFAATPDTIEPDQKLIDLLTGLTSLSNFRVIILSGRKLSHIQALLPVPHLMLYGSYGQEGPSSSTSEEFQTGVAHVRKTLDRVKPQLEALLGNHAGFFLEDKGLTLAVHARFAEPAEAIEVLGKARKMMEVNNPSGELTIRGSEVFLEISPAGANKRAAVRRILPAELPPGDAIVYIGDDDNDEEAFSEIKAHGGLAILVSAFPRRTAADFRFESSAKVRAWLANILSQLLQRGS